MQSDPLFSIIVVDYEGSVSRDDFRRKMRSLSRQTSKNFELLVYHDGPKATPYEQDAEGIDLPARTSFFVTPERKGDWGFSNRDAGIRAACGEWIIHSNADNVFYPHLIETLEAALTRDSIAFRQEGWALPGFLRGLGRMMDRRFGTKLLDRGIVSSERKDALVYAVRMMGLLPMSNRTRYVPERSQQQAVILGGVPVRESNIDAMQFVMRRELWLAEGGWHDRSRASDGKLYSAFARKYFVHAVPEVLGEHW